jgi:hypothetical protein
MRSRTRGVAALSAVLALAGCALTPPQTRPPNETPDPVAGCRADVLGVAQDLASLRALPPEDLRRALEERRAACAADPTSENRTRLTLALALGRPATRLSLPPDAVQSAGRRESVGESLCSLAEVLLAEMEERQRCLDRTEDEAKALRQRIAALEASLRRALARNGDLEQRLGAIRRELAREHAEAETLQQQLDGLRDIERSLGARRSGAPLPPPPDYDAEQGQGPAGR